MNALEIKQLHKVYANGIHALKGIDLTVKSGEFFALLGANGAGKSTTIGLISTLLKKTSGTIELFGYDLYREPELAKACLGLVPQEFNLNIFETCEQILFNQAGYYGLIRKSVEEQVHKLLRQLGLWDKRSSVVRHLSGGMKRRLMIARALVHKPKLLILDEPTAGVDVEIRRSMWDFLNQINLSGTTIILTTHYLEEAEHLCKRIAIIDKGNIVRDTSVEALLHDLHHQTFVFNTKAPIQSLPVADGIESILLDEKSFELRMDNQKSLNAVFSILSKFNIEVLSMRNKTNRLEELFMDLIKHDN